ncbi:MAG: redox-regulated ATPase YchF [Nanoarchaeota archaeon]
MQIGLVGAPSAGKSTFFKAATLVDVAIANYPFTTIKPNVGISFVKIDCVDREFNVQCNPREGYCLQGKRFVPVQLIDVAGLVPGAHEGKGMGNQFLSDLNQADVLIHVIDCSGSTNEKGEPAPQGTHDPLTHVAFLEQELDLWYLSIIQKGWDKFARTVEHEQENLAKAVAKQLSGLRVTETMTKEALKDLPLHPTQWTEAQLLQLAHTLRKRSKPMIIAANKIDLKGAEEQYKRLKKAFPDSYIIPCSAAGEIALKEAARKKYIHYVPGDAIFQVTGEITEAQRQGLDLIQKNILEPFQTTGVQTILNTAVFELLHYIAVFPGGAKLVDKDGRYIPDCFLLPPQSTALDFAYRLHTDIGNNFVKAVNIKTKRVVGKEYVLQHRDVVEIMVKK